MTRYSASKTKGFTLVELITVIIVLGVVSVGISGFIRAGVDIYSDVSERDQLLGNSRFFVERLNRELRMAVPNSIRVTNNQANTIQCIEFVPAKWVTFYTTLPKIPDPSKVVTVVEIAGNPAGYQVNNGHFAVVYPTQNSDIYNLGNNKRQQITACTDGDGDCNNLPDPLDTERTAELTVTAAFADYSPASRLYFVSETISYCLHDIDNKVYRHQSDTFDEMQTIYNSTDGGVLMAENLINDLDLADQQPFRIINASLTRNALVQMLLTFELNEEIVNYSNEVHIPNVP
jgi:MSHA biogenesis protein MshO